MISFSSMTTRILKDEIKLFNVRVPTKELRFSLLRMVDTRAHSPGSIVDIDPGILRKLMFSESST